MIEVVEKCLDLLSREPDPIKKICSSSAYFNPLVWLYDELKKNKDIEPLSYLPLEKKQELWDRVIKERPDKDKYIKALICQAIHAYETVTFQSHNKQ